MSTIFTGSYDYQIDPKGRMRMPTDFRSVLGDDLRIGLGYGKYLVVYTNEAVEEIGDKKRTVDQFREPEAYRYYSNILRGLKRFKADAQGRYTIPQDFCDLVGLTGEIVVAGNGDVVEIWSKANFDRRDDDEIAYWRPGKQ